MQIQIVDIESTRRTQIVSSLTSALSLGDDITVSDIIVNDLSALNCDLLFLHSSNTRSDITFTGLTKDVVIYSGGSFRDLSDAEIASGKVFKIYRSLDRGAFFSENLKQGFKEILEYFKNGKPKDHLPSLLVKVAYPDALVAYYLAMVAKKPTLIEELKGEAIKYYEQLKAKHEPVEGTFDQAGIKALFTKMANI